MTKTHHLNIPSAGAKDWIITRIDPTDRKIIQIEIEEILEEARSLSEESLFSNDRASLSTATIRLCEAVESLASILI